MNKTSAILAVAGLTAPLALGAQTLDLPPRKPGLWEMLTIVEGPKGMPALNAKLCLDPASDREMMEYALQLTGECKRITTRREGKSIILESDCTIGGRPSKTRSVITGDFQSGYTARIEGTVDRGEGKGPEKMTATQTMTWKSADCPGMKPGDMTMLGGIKVNIKQIKALSGMFR